MLELIPEIIEAQKRQSREETVIPYLILGTKNHQQCTTCGSVFKDIDIACNHMFEKHGKEIIDMETLEHPLYDIGDMTASCVVYSKEPKGTYATDCDYYEIIFGCNVKPKVIEEEDNKTQKREKVRYNTNVGEDRLGEMINNMVEDGIPMKDICIGKNKLGRFTLHYYTDREVSNE